MTILFPSMSTAQVLSFGYFFRGGGKLFRGFKEECAEYTVEGYNERAFISMNQQQVTQLEIDDGNTIQVLDIDSNKPFAIVLPINAGTITFYDVNGNTVECLDMIPSLTTSSLLSLHIGSTCPELLQLNTRRPHSGTPSRKSEKGLLLFFCPK